MFGPLAKFIKLLNSETADWQLALALCFALFVVLTPFWSLHNLIILLLVCLLRVNLSFFFLSMAVLAAPTLLLTPWIHSLGESLLINASLKSFWTDLYASELARLFNFNHTLVLGGSLISLALFVPVFFLARSLISSYRGRFMHWVSQFHLVKWIKASDWVQNYLVERN